MPTTALLKEADKLAHDYGKHLSRVLAELEQNLVDVLAGKRGASTFDAAALLNSRPEMLEALRQAGYYDLAEAYVEKYGDIPEQAAQALKGRKLPPPQFTTADAKTFTDIARADLERFAVIGERGMDELRLNLYRQAVSEAPFSDMVASVRAATVGTAANGSPLYNYAYTHANTAVLNTQGQVLQAAGESIGAERWEVVGPSDDVTRDECLAALANPIRSKAEWIAADYWGGTPGGWNCRHQLFPSLK